MRISVADRYDVIIEIQFEFRMKNVFNISRNSSQFLYHTFSILLVNMWVVRTANSTCEWYLGHVKSRSLCLHYISQALSGTKNSLLKSDTAHPVSKMTRLTFRELRLCNVPEQCVMSSEYYSNNIYGRDG